MTKHGKLENDAVQLPLWTKVLPWILLISTSVLFVLVVQKSCANNPSQESLSQESVVMNTAAGSSQGIIDLEVALGNATAESREFDLDGITFVEGSARLSKESIQVLEQLLAVLEKYQTAHIRLEGYCLEQQNAMANLRISHQRAVAVANYLKERGINDTRLRTVGRGDSRTRNSAKSSPGVSQYARIGLIVESY